MIKPQPVSKGDAPARAPRRADAHRRALLAAQAPALSEGLVFPMSVRTVATPGRAHNAVHEGAQDHPRAPRARGHDESVRGPHLVVVLAAPHSQRPSASHGRGRGAASDHRSLDDTHERALLARGDRRTTQRSSAPRVSCDLGTDPGRGVLCSSRLARPALVARCCPSAGSPERTLNSLKEIE